jgi:hypothetical protein
MRRAIRLVLPFLLLTLSCTDSTGPESVPASLEISPATLELGIGEIRRLEARIRDAQGLPLDGPQGLHIVWTSADSTLVAVDATGLARGVRVGGAAITAAAVVDGVQIEGRADASVLAAEFTTDEGAAAHATLGPEGGTMSASAADGTRYTLTVPTGALLDETNLSLTPLGVIQHFPGGGTAAGGAHFAPEGLRFYTPATLTIELPAGSDAATYTGFAYSGEGAELHLYPTVAAGTTLSFAVPHFSGYGLSQLTLEEIANFPSPSHAGALAQQALVQLLAGSAAGEPVEDEDFVVLVRFWYTDVLRPALIAAGVDPGVDDDAYLAAELEYLVWQRAVLLYGPFLGNVLDAERMEAVSLLAGAIRGSIEAHNQRCRDTNDFAQAYQVTRFQLVAASFGLDGVGEFGLDPVSVQETLCLDVVIEELSFPEMLGPGEEGMLDLRAGYRIEGHPTVFSPIILIDVFASAGATGDHLSGTTSGEGHFAATVVWPASEPALTLDIKACLDWSGLFLFTEMEVCAERQEVRQAGILVVQATFPDSVVADRPAALQVRAGRQTGDGVIEYDAGLTVDLVVSGGAAAPQGGATDSDGYFDAQITPYSTGQTLVAEITVTGDGDRVTEVVQAVVVDPPGQVTPVEIWVAACGSVLTESVADIPFDLSNSSASTDPFGNPVNCTGTAALSITTQPDGTVVIDGGTTAITNASEGAGWYLGIRTTGGDFQYEFEANVEGVSGFIVLMTELGSNVGTGRTFLSCTSAIADPCRDRVSGILSPNHYAVVAHGTGIGSIITSLRLTLTPVQ